MMVRQDRALLEKNAKLNKRERAFFADQGLPVTNAKEFTQEHLDVWNAKEYRPSGELRWSRLTCAGRVLREGTLEADGETYLIPKERVQGFMTEL